MSFSKQGIAIAGLAHSYFEIFFDLNRTHSEGMECRKRTNKERVQSNAVTVIL